jgi:hypothetical protein
MRTASFLCGRWALFCVPTLMSMLAWLALAQSTSANIPAMRVCVVQAKSGIDDGETSADARVIATELSTLTLKNGVPVRGIALTGVSNNQAGSLINRAACLYAVDVHRYNPPQTNDVALPGDLSPDLRIPQGPSPSWPRDQIVLLYRIKLVGSRKVLYSGSAYPPSFSLRHSGPAVAAQIVKTLNQGKLNP